MEIKGGNYSKSLKRLATIISTSILVVALLMAGCSAVATSTLSSPASVTSFRNVDAGEAFTLIQQNRDNPDFVIIDVRTPEEFSGGHIAGSVLIDFYASNFQNELDKLDRSKQYLVYCRSGNRSAQAARTMINLGFKSVYNLNAGINEWISEGYPVVS